MPRYMRVLMLATMAVTLPFAVPATEAGKEPQGPYPAPSGGADR
jgi:hypothetical protein